MKTTHLLPVLISTALALVAAPATYADGPAPRPGVAAATSGPKDYSRNAATGDYRRPYAQRVRTSSLAGTTSPPRRGRPAPAAADGVDWRDAGIGAAVGVVVALAATGVALSLRRARPAHS
jgi:hypothetical protein